MSHNLLGTIVASALTLSISVQVSAETSDEDAYKYRETFMTALKGHAGAVSMQARGLAGDPEYVAKHARAIANLGSELHLVFAEGSNIHGSAAMPAIWEKPEEFALAVKAAEEAMTALGETAEGGDMKAIGVAFRNVGKACKGCHDNFREEHEH